jgi:hypothetical protein
MVSHTGKIQIENGGRKMKTMKRRNKKAMLTLTCAACATLMLLTVGSWTASAGGFLATEKTVAENEAAWGAPTVIQVFDNGTEKRFYKYTNNTMINGFRCFLCKDGKVIADGGFEATAPEVQKVQSYRVVKAR